jgi:hypothetical protein
MMDELLYTQEDIDEWIRICEELQERNRELEQDLTEINQKIEQGTLISIEDVSKLMLKMWGNPCEYEICGENAIDVIHKYTDYDWCERNCSNAMDNGLCWEQYIKAKLKELQNG